MDGWMDGWMEESSRLSAGEYFPSAVVKTRRFIPPTEEFIETR
jgi:hypothetical protein